MTTGLLEIDIDPAALRSLNRAKDNLGKKLILDALERQLAVEGSRTAAHVVKSKLSGEPLRRRTAILAKSVTSQVLRSGGLPAFRVGVLRGPALAYAGALEYGATIKPKRTKALTIPVEGGRAVTPAGVHRYTTAREYPGELVYIPAEKPTAGNIATLWDERDLGPDGVPKPGAKPVYVLAHRVKIPAKHWLKLGVEEYLPQVETRIGTWFQDYVRNAVTNPGRARDPQGRFL